MGHEVKISLTYLQWSSYVVLISLQLIDVLRCNFKDVIKYNIIFTPKMGHFKTICYMNKMFKDYVSVNPMFDQRNFVLVTYILWFSDIA